MNVRTSYLLTAAIVASLTLAGCKKKTDDAMADAPAPIATTPAPSMTPAPAPAAVTVTSVTLGTSAGPDKRIATPMTLFKANDPIVVSVATSGVAQNVDVRGKLVFQDGQTAGEQPTMVDTTGDDMHVLTFTNANAWPAGAYKAEIWVNGQMAQSQNFTVQ